MNPVNNLSLFQKKFGTAGIEVRNVIANVAKSINDSATIEYTNQNNLLIKDLGESTLESLSKALHSKNTSSKYHHWHLHIQQQASSKNFLIKINPIEIDRPTILEDDHPDFKGFPIYHYPRKGSIFSPDNGFSEKNHSLLFAKITKSREL